MQVPICVLVLVVMSAAFFAVLTPAEGGKIHIPDDLEDVVDDEEDESWREWGKQKRSPPDEPPPPDFADMSASEIQEMMAKSRVGPVYGFVKLRLGVHRTPKMVGEIAMKWTKLSMTGGVEVSFTGMDLGTVMFNMEHSRDTQELKDFILNQEEAYEVKIGDQVFRRPGDPPLEQVLEDLQRQKDVDEPEPAKEEL